MPPKVHILIPHRGETDYREWRDWFLITLQKPPGTLWNEMRLHNLVTMRTMLAKLALKGDADYLYWADDDLVGPPNIIEALLAVNKPIACGLYMAKKPKAERGLSAWMRVNRPGETPWGTNGSKPGYMSIQREQPGRLIQVDVTGLGCALVHRSVFEQTPEPWFHWEPDGISEDFFFFEKVSQHLGIKPIIDMECRFDHMGSFKVNVDGEFNTLER